MVYLNGCQFSIVCVFENHYEAAYSNTLIFLTLKKSMYNLNDGSKKSAGGSLTEWIWIPWLESNQKTVLISVFPYILLDILNSGGHGYPLDVRLPPQLLHHHHLLLDVGHLDAQKKTQLSLSLSCRSDSSNF